MFIRKTKNNKTKIKTKIKTKKIIKRKNNKIKKGGSPPYFILTAGQTGSGKSSLLEKIKKHLGLEIQPIKLFIDDYIENRELTKQNVNELLIEIIKNILKQDEEKFSVEVLYQKFNEIYFRSRKEKGCLKDNSIHNCDEILDLELKTHLESNKDILLETTGLNPPKWIFTNEEFSNIDHYTVILAYSVVQLCELYIRIRKRFIASLQTYLSDTKSHPAPRLPSLSDDFIENTEKIIHMLFTIIEQCIISNNDYCGNKKPFRLLIFDNSDRDSKLLYDSINPFTSKIKQHIIDAFSINNIC